ncbi:unnamed protein product [Protopolystoma xenopodis]|uniref:Uncharacterized protein n=1 Tax=Protopolystoma xenopodis TaxID=117903 RepID=A0A448XNQ3_9PLAT|nr:unnamed protein product [Protopolystoma xenopodis]
MLLSADGLPNNYSHCTALSDRILRFAVLYNNKLSLHGPQSSKYLKESVKSTERHLGELASARFQLALDSKLKQRSLELDLLAVRLRRRESMRRWLTSPNDQAIGGASSLGSGVNLAGCWAPEVAGGLFGRHKTEIKDPPERCGPTRLCATFPVAGSQMRMMSARLPCNHGERGPSDAWRLDPKGPEEHQPQESQGSCQDGQKIDGELRPNELVPKRSATIHYCKDC